MRLSELFYAAAVFSMREEALKWGFVTTIEETVKRADNFDKLDGLAKEYWCEKMRSVLNNAYFPTSTEIYAYNIKTPEERCEIRANFFLLLSEQQLDKETELGL